jgi:MFS transporter, putative metabolite:H+ symporter
MDFKTNKMVIATVFVAALGYMVDIYDLILFSVVRVQSLKDIGMTAEQIDQDGLGPLNWQMGGMLIGGLLWGIMGDKLGRLSVLFGSILLYSIANAANAFVYTFEQYEWLRLIAGIGLAGELGAGITLVSEVMSKENRGIGTTIVATVGVAGAVLAYFVSTTFDWRIAYLVGAVMGLMLLILRISVFESNMFEGMKKSNAKRGNFLMLFSRKDLFIRYLKCILIGLPTWLFLGIFVTSSSTFGKAFGIENAQSLSAKSVMWCYVGLIVGDLASGLLSQYLKSRRYSLMTFATISIFTMAYYLTSTKEITADQFYFKMFLLGAGMGYWALFVTVGSEHFGTNIRATVTTTVPNFARGLLVPLSLGFQAMSKNPSIGVINAGWILGLATLGIALVSMYFMEETFGKDLDYVEE